MIARPNWFWSSLFSSLTVNAILFISTACYLYSHTPIWEPGWPTGTSLPVDDATPFFIPHIADTLLGESTGKGTATDATPGDTPQEARLADQDQSFLSRDPAGPGHIGDPPAFSTQLPGENGTGQPGQPTKFGIEQNENSATAQPVFTQPTQSPATPAQPNSAKPNPSQPKPENQTQSQTSPEQPDNSDSDATKTTIAPPLIAQSSEIDKPQPTTQSQLDWRSAVASIAEASPTFQQQEPQPNQAQPAQQQSAENISPTAGKPGPNKPPADPAPQADTESDPFSTKGSVKFKQGSTEVQFGRKHKLVRPQLGLGAQADLLQLRQPIVLILALSLDETGKVTRVTILQSSGSANIDEACKVAAYQWWLEPTKDKDGKPIKDVIPFKIGFS